MTTKKRQSTKISGPVAGGQSKISFGSHNKVTKPTSEPPTKKRKSLPEKAILQEESPVAEVQVEKDDDITHESEAKAVEEEGEVEVQTSPEEDAAQKITTKELNKYWLAIQAKRRAPRVHQKDLSLNEKILRHFDVSNQYGPCTGISRSKRWTRANALNLSPPIEVLAALLQEEKTSGDDHQTSCVDALIV